MITDKSIYPITSKITTTVEETQLHNPYCASTFSPGSWRTRARIFPRRPGDSLEARSVDGWADWQSAAPGILL